MQASGTAPTRCADRWSSTRPELPTARRRRPIQTLLDELRARPVTLDLCPTSNVQSTSVASLAEHPLARLARAGVPVTLSTDDRTVSDVTLPAEYERVHRVLDLSPAELWRINRHALDVAFLQHDEALRGHLKDEFDTFAAAEPLLRESATG